jgi:integrase
MAKQKRRGKGEGSIYFDKKNIRWVGSFYTEDGKRKYAYGRTEKEAREKLRTAQYEDKQGTLATGPQQTVKQYMEYWLEKVHKPAIRISSYVEYRRILNNHILPALGHIRLQKLTVQQVESLYAQKAKEGLSARRIMSIHGVLRKGLAHAVYLNLVPRNVCDIVKRSLPHQVRHEAQTLTKEQAQRLLEGVRGHYPWETLFTLAITTGMRRGELAALRWSDIHFEEKYLQVRRSVRQAGLGYGLQVSEPKTASSRRKIVLSPFLVEVLQQHRVRQEEAQCAAGEAWKDSELVFSSGDGGFINLETMRTWFKRLLRVVGLPSIRFHDLRHSAATLLLEMGVHIKVVQELLGHSNVLITLNIYSHVLPSLHEEAVGELSNLFTYERGDGNGTEDQGDGTGSGEHMGDQASGIEGDGDVK